MDQAADLTESTSIVCANCRAENISTQKFCSSCSFPIAGTQEERSHFIARIGTHKLHIQRAQKKIQDGKMAIYVIAGLQFLFAMIVFFQNDDFVSMIINLFICLLYLILAAWADKNPLPAILTAFIVFLTLILFNFFVNPASLFSLIILKIAIIAGFVKGIRSAQEAQASMKELEKYKVQ